MFRGIRPRLDDDLPMVLGIDPGLGGGIAWIWDDYRVFTVAMPTKVVMKSGRRRREIDYYGLHKSISMFGDIIVMAYVEQVWAARAQGRQQGGSSMFSFGGTYHCVLQCLACNSVPYEIVSPQKWKRVLGLKGKDKDASRTKANELMEEHKESWILKKDIGQAEAALIAYYGLLKHRRRRLLY